MDSPRNRRSQLGHALREGIAVAIGADRVDRCVLDRLRDREVRLPDREVDRVVKLRTQLEDTPDAGDIDGEGSIAEQVLEVEPASRHSVVAVVPLAEHLEETVEVLVEPVAVSNVKGNF